MIPSIRHKALNRLSEDDDHGGIISQHAERVRDILARLDASASITDMDLPGFRLHPLKGELKGYWAATVRANWRLIFRFVQGHAFDVDYVDCH